MNRTIKFRAWDKINKQIITDCNKYTHYHFGINYQKDIEFMQFTGLKDKNGVEIYEGDIIKGDWISCDSLITSTFKVKYLGAGFSPFAEPAGDSSGVLYQTSLFSGDFEVIGNIFENPELLTL